MSDKTFNFLGTILTALVAGFFLLASNDKLPNVRPFLEYMFSSSANWVIIFRDGHMLSAGPSECTNQIVKFSDEGQAIKRVSFTTHGGCVILLENNGYAAVGVSQELISYLSNSYNEGSEIRQVEFAKDDGWIILLGRNGYVSNNAPSGLIERLDVLRSKASKINQIAIMPNQGWIIIYDDFSYVSQGVSNTLTHEVAKLLHEKIQIKQLSFAPDVGWVMLVRDKNDFWHSSIPVDMLDSFNISRQLGREILCFAFVPIPESD